MNRGLLVGINAYPGSPLEGCVNDVTDIAKFIVENCGFSKSDIRLLTDARATRDAIFERLGWLLNGLREGDRVLFYYSGHGVLMPSRNPQGDVDRVHDAICPVDFDWTKDHAITDTDFKGLFSSVPKGVEFVWISDSCHCGQLISSRGIMPPGTRIKSFPIPADIEWRIQVAREKNIQPMGFIKATGDINVALITACKSEQTAADASFDDGSHGVLTYYLLKKLKDPGGLKEPLIKVVADFVDALVVEARFEQVPQLVGSRVIKERAFLAIAWH